MSLLDHLREQRDQLDERISLMENQPEEPTADSGPTIICFQVTYRRGAVYTYVALKPEGTNQWYLAGQNHTCTWDDIMTIASRRSADSKVSPLWMVTEYTELQ